MRKISFLSFQFLWTAFCFGVFGFVMFYFLHMLPVWLNGVLTVGAGSIFTIPGIIILHGLYSCEQGQSFMESFEKLLDDAIVIFPF